MRKANLFTDKSVALPYPSTVALELPRLSLNDNWFNELFAVSPYESLHTVWDLPTRPNENMKLQRDHTEGWQATIQTIQILFRALV